MKRIIRDRRLTDEEAAHARAIRTEFASRPNEDQLRAMGYEGPMNLEEFMAFRKKAGDAPLTRQLQAAIAASGQSLYAVAQGSGVSAPSLQRFVLGERGITLETAAKVAAYLGLVLMPDLKAKK